MLATQLDVALDALDEMCAALDSGDARSIARARRKCAGAAKTMRRNVGPVFRLPLPSKGAEAAATVQVSYDSCGVMAELILDGQEHAYAAIVELDRGAMMVALSGTAQSDDTIAACHLDDRGLHVQGCGVAGHAAVLDELGIVTTRSCPWQPASPAKADIAA